MGDLPFNQRAEAQVCYGRAPQLEVVMMLSGDLAADQYWKERASLLTDSTFEFFQRDASEGFPDLMWIDGDESGQLSLLDIFARVGALRQLTKP